MQWTHDPAIGVDIKLNQGDLGYTVNGDLDLVGNVNPADNVWQAVVLRLLTTLGTYIFENGYGTHARQYVDEPMTDDLKQKIRNETNTTGLSDPRVKKIVNLTVDDSSTPGAYQISFGILTVGGYSASGSVVVGG